MSFFDELLALDRPFVDIKIKFKGKEMACKARRPSAMEQDSLDAFYADEYARLIIDKTESKPGVQSELERVRFTYSTRSRAEIMTQIMGTRSRDVQSRAIEVGGDELQDAIAGVNALEGDPAQKEANEAVRATLTELFAGARAEIESEYEEKSNEELVELISQININMKSIGEASARQTARRLFYVLYETEEKHIFDNIEDVLKLSSEVINQLVESVDRAFIAAVPVDLPFDSAAEPAPSKQPSSQSTSAGATKVGGRRTRTTRKNSK